jgi:hypothetical protein
MHKKNKKKIMTPQRFEPKQIACCPRIVSQGIIIIKKNHNYTVFNSHEDLSNQFEHFLLFQKILKGL